MLSSTIFIQSKTRHNPAATFWYRGPVIWNFIARLANFNVNIQKDSFKNILRRLSQNINSFLFEAPMIAMKDRDFVYF